MIQTKQDIIQIIKKDAWMMEALYTAKSLQLPDWWICAGFVRAKVWDVLHDYSERTPIQDIDVIYFDTENFVEQEEKRLERILQTANGHYPWSVKNEARMHICNGIEPYVSSEDAIAKFPETATSLGVKLNEHDNIILTAPHGIDDCVQMRVKPTPYFLDNPELLTIYHTRLTEKNWSAVWPKLTFKR
ncbi:hypothetical protein GCM10011409_41950 [Lentibacillus populi]|uniref:Nucleotidyltransferase family protein n=2 Tax=Bacillales TaxID=1385 RepID=A0A9W5U1E6_9BACI|nr:hypothetical protein GCM10011409_41950 [Lentibacillus populi]